MPNKEIAADRFIKAHPHFDGRGVVIAIFDSGVDPSADGLQVTTDGKPKILDVLDCTGSGDIDTSTVVKADADGCIRGASGASLVVNSSWNNPSGEWHVGFKLVFELFTSTLTSRLKKDRRKIWDEKIQEAITKAVKHVYEFEKKHTKIKGANLKKNYEDLKNRVGILRKQAESYDDKGPFIDAVVWHDGKLWRVALDIQSLEDEPGVGKLSDFVPLTNYREERKYGTISKLDACTFVTNVYDEGNVLSIVTDSSPHGTHVAGITAAFHPKEPLLNGVAPGAQLISCKIGDSCLGLMGTRPGLTRAVIAALEHKCNLVNVSYGEPTLLPNYGEIVDLVNKMVDKYGIVFVNSAGNNRPGLSTVGAPGGTTSSILGIGAYVSPAMAAGAHCVVEAPSEGLVYTWFSRGPTVDGDLGVSVSALGGAVAPIPTWTLQRCMLMYGTSMSSLSACGGIALLISGIKSEGNYVNANSVRRAIENTCFPIGDLPEDKLSSGQGPVQVDKTYEYIQKCRNMPCVWYQININQASKPSPTSRGIYLSEAGYCQQSTEWTVQVEPKFHEDASNLVQSAPFGEYIELHSTDEAVVKAPEYLHLTHDDRSFKMIVDPTNITEGFHHYEVYGIDTMAPWRGPLFRIPVTIMKPMSTFQNCRAPWRVPCPVTITEPEAVKNRSPLVSYQGTSFQPDHIERRYTEVPYGVTNEEEEVEDDGDASSGSKRTKKIPSYWNEEEDQVLVKAWIEYSPNPKMGMNQSSGMFWKKIVQCVNEHTTKTRTKHGCKARWQKISKEVGQYIAAVSTSTKRCGSEGGNEDIRNEAIKIFKQDQNHHFIMNHLYLILCEVSKFRSQHVPGESDAPNISQSIPNNQSSEGSPKRLRLNKRSAKSISTNESTHDSKDPLTPFSRPMCVKASKGLGKGRRKIVGSDEGLSVSINDFVAVQRERLKMKRLELVEMERMERERLEIKRLELVEMERERLEIKRLELVEMERGRKSAVLNQLLSLGRNITPELKAIRDKLMTELYL